VLALGFRRVAVEIFRADHLGRENRPGLGHLDVLLLEDRFAGIIGDLGRALLPLDLVEGFHFGVAEHAVELQGRPAGRGRGDPAGRGGFRAAAERLGGRG
jgi:hypothetical protein